MATNLNLSECTPTFIIEKHYEYPERMQYVIGKLTHPTLGELATVRCLQIHYRMLFKNSGDFLEIMDEDSQELHEFSAVLFDKYSNVRPWLVDGGAKSGSGCWATELSVGDMLYIEDVKVKEEFRRRGVGSWLLQKLLSSPHIGYRGHAFCWPTPIGFTGDDKAEWTKEQDSITAFYRKNGFRRIGLTQFLGYSPDPSHPSRKLTIASDPETPSRNFDSVNPNAPELSADELKAQYPLHIGIATTKTPAVAQFIRDVHQVDGGILHKRDPHGFTPVHVAAASENVHASRTLLELDPSGTAEDLKDTKNKDAMTPLEVLKSAMRSTKEFMETLLGVWNGYTDEGMSCEYILTKAAGLPLMEGEQTEEEYIKKRKFGCTCGLCTDGWLSPRMRFRLSAQAALQSDMLRMDLCLFKPHHPLPASEICHSAIDYLPPTIRREIYKTFYVGFYTIFYAIHQILETPRTPTPQLVVEYALALDAGAVRFYLNKGGKAEYILDATVDSAKEQSSLGDGTFEETFEHEESEDGTFEETFEHEESEEGEVGYADLAKCANDLEFGNVRKNFGLGVNVRWGPYEDREEDGMEVDEDDSDSD